jgi:hypothetical protein
LLGNYLFLGDVTKKKYSGAFGICWNKVKSGQKKGEGVKIDLFFRYQRLISARNRYGRAAYLNTRNIPYMEQRM